MFMSYIPKIVFRFNNRNEKAVGTKLSLAASETSIHDTQGQATLRLIPTKMVFTLIISSETFVLEFVYKKLHSMCC